MTIFIVIAIVVFVIILYVSHKSESHEEVQKELSAKYVSDDEVLTNAVGFLAKSEALRQSEIMGDDKTHSAILENTYKGPWPERRGGDGWLSIYDDLRILNVAGMSFRQGINRYKGFIDAALVPEPKNEFDPNAIKVVAIDGHHLGYIPAGQTDFVRSLTGESFPYRCKCEVIEGYNDDDEKTYHGFVYIKRKDKGE
jgi:hypothetical protein